MSARPVIQPRTRKEQETGYCWSVPPLHSFPIARSAEIQKEAQVKRRPAESMKCASLPSTRSTGIAQTLLFLIMKQLEVSRLGDGHQQGRLQ